MKAIRALDKTYGFFGWKEFNTGRRDLLDKYAAAKRKNSNKKVRTDHGVVAEAAFRAWLTQLLPKRFGVTSGYIVPDLVVSNYELEHFDVIVYDALESPILWIDGSEDDSEQGRSRAIPAKHVRAVVEVKATLTPSHAGDAMKKLASLSKIHEHLTDPFNTSIVFFELANADANVASTLRNLVPDPPVHGYVGGLVLSSSLNDAMSGLFWVQPPPADSIPAMSPADRPLAIDIDETRLQFTSTGDVRINGARASVSMLYWGNSWHAMKGYTCHWSDERFFVSLEWSRNAFASFTLQMLGRITGQSQDRSKLVFGQVFDRIEPFRA